MPIWKRGTQQDPAVARAQAAMAEIAALRMTRFSGTTTFSNRPRPSTNTGVRDFAGNAMHQFLTVDETTTEAVVKRDIVYLRLDEATAAEVGKTWVARRYLTPKTEPLVGPETVGAVIATATAVTDLGPEPTDEGEPTRLQAVFQPGTRSSGRSGGPQARRVSDLMQQLKASTVTVDLFIDDTDRLRRYRISWPDITASNPDEGTYQVKLVREYFDFGVQAEVTLPRALDVLMQGHLPADLTAYPVSSAGARSASTASS